MYEAGDVPTLIGTAIDIPGGYLIRGLPDGNYYVLAYMDHLGFGKRNVMNPVGQTGVFNVSGANVASQDITLGDPAAPSPPVPVNLVGHPGDTSVLLVWDTPRDANEIETAESYKIYWCQAACPSGGTPSLTDNDGTIPITAKDDTHFFEKNLTNGSFYTYTVASVTNGIDSAPSAPVSVTAGNPAGGQDVSGFLTFLPASGPLVVGVVDTTGTTIRYAWDATPVSDPFLIFNIPNVPDGEYRLFAFIDNNNDGQWDLGDDGSNDMVDILVVVSGAPVGGYFIGLNSDAYFYRLISDHRLDDLGNQSYNMALKIIDGVSLPKKVEITSGAMISTTMDMGKYQGNHEFWFYNTAIPVPGEQYQVNVALDTITAQGASPQLEAVLDEDSFATPTDPTTTASSLTPTFTWTAPISPPLDYHYSISLYDTVLGQQIWTVDWLSSTATSALYNDPALGPVGPALVSGRAYRWTIVVYDVYGDRASWDENFVTP